MKRLILVTVIVFIDQFSKYLIKSNYFIYESKSIIGNLVRFTYIENPGLAFGLSVGKLKWLLFVITLLIAMYIANYLFNTAKLAKYEALSLCFILGGAIGNLIDRGFALFGLFDYKGVIDFIDIGLFAESYRWFIFNIADSSVTIGVGIFIICSYFCSKSDMLEHENS